MLVIIHPSSGLYPVKSKFFDPGAGGRHKQRRGFPATPNHSLHRFYHNHLGQLLRRYISQANHHEAQQIIAMNADLPFNPNPS